MDRDINHLQTQKPHRSDPSGHPGLLCLKSVGCVVLMMHLDTKDLPVSEVWSGSVLHWWTDELTSALC